LILATTPAGEAAVLNLNPSEFTRFMEDHNDARCFAGYDVGRVRDNGEFSALMVLPNAELGVERLAKTFPARTFEEQEDYLRWFKRHPRTFLAIDKGGMGMNTAEKLVTEFGANQVKAVDFGSNIPAPFQYQREDAQAKTVLAVTLKQVMLSDLVRWQVDVGKNYQMHSVRRAVTEAMRVVYKVDTEGDVKHHADVFWARALAAWMWRFTDSHQLRFAAVA
jgi:phage FluMu gp28-like protein